MTDSTVPTAAAPSAHAFVCTREFDAPRERVFQAWGEADRLAQWWGCGSVTVLGLDFSPGGTFFFSLAASDGSLKHGKFVYRDILAPERLVFVNSFATDTGETTRAPFSETWPLEVLHTLTFTEAGGKTTLHMVAEPLSAADAERETFRGWHGNMHQGFGATLDQLAAYLATAQPAASGDL